MKQVAGYVTAKSMLYKSNVEYADYAMTPVRGCDHRCDYCYAFRSSNRYGRVDNMETWGSPYLVANTIDLLKKEVPKLKPYIKDVFMSFMCDVFLYDYPEVASMTMNTIAYLNSEGIKCKVLTKGVLPMELAQFSPLNEYGVTISSINQLFCDRVEPGAAPVAYRIDSLRRLHDLGCKTWVSIEPYPFPGYGPDDLDVILENLKWVDHIVFGKMNYVKGSSMHKEFYNSKVRQLKDFSVKNGIPYYIKDKTWTPCEMCVLV